MTDITKEKHRLLVLYAQKYCGINDVSLCQKKPCSCGIAAEFRAVMNMTIPEPFRKFTIRDFHGKISDDIRLDNVVAMRAKQQVFKYCWGNLALLDRLSSLTDEELDKNSKMAEHVANGHGVVIHGNSVRRLHREDAKHSITEVKLGRTFIASIITKEAIKLKLDPKFRTSSFEWIQFSNLIKSLKEDGNESLHYENCDWLVVDDITPNLLGATPAHKAFTEPLLDSFFARRVRAKRPTVLVFKFNIEERMTEMDSAFGVTVGKIIRDRNTCVIRLNDGATKE